MLKRLRKKFIISNTMHVGIVLVVVFLAICMITYSKRYSSLEETLTNALYESRKGPMRYAPISLSENASLPDTEFIPYVICVLPEHTMEDMRVFYYGATISEEALNKLIEYALESEDMSGGAEDSLYFVKEVHKNETRIAITNDSHIIASTKSLAAILSLIGLLSVYLVVGVSYLVSKGALLSTENAWEQQKRFIADASHALKTPLTVILANIEILKSGKMGKAEEIMHWLKSTEDEAHEMHHLVREMLVLVQSDLNVRREEFTQINLSQLLTGLTLQFEALAFDKHIDMEILIPDGVEHRGNEKGLSRMFSALIENALKYEKEGGRIRISLEKQVRRTYFSVYNASTWIRPEEQERIFERFCRLKNAQNANVEGNGLGLSIARTVADAHDAIIDVISSETGGTEFRVSFKNKLVERGK
ncbi:MAG: HAMP domain-containing histidine kinase [Clostridia bacterium]|nr:HAMP domain-containing histidine kinase [Clostridia bacterium]